MILRTGILVTWALTASLTWSQEPPTLRPQSDVQETFRSQAIEEWEDDIRDLEKLDESEKHDPDAILLLGSSSIRRWENVDVDMAPYRIIRRGYGGAKYSDLAVFSQRLIKPHSYRGLVLFVGNDVAGEPEDHTPDQVEGWVRHIIGVSRGHQPDAPVFLIEVTPTIKRFSHWPQIRELNARLREIALSTPMVFFVSTAGQMLDPQAKPRTDLFVDDQLHLNEAGYAVWSQQIRDRLDEVFRLIARYPTAD